METTTHSTSKGDVLPETDPNEHPPVLRVLPISVRGEETSRRTFEQRTIRTLLSFERKRLAMQRTELALEETRLTMQRESVASLNAQRATSSQWVSDLVQLAVPLMTSFLEQADADGALDDDALEAAIVDIASEFPDLKETLEARVRAARKAESRASVG